MRITELVPGDEVAGWMKIGRALKPGRHFDGTKFRYVPLVSAVAEQDDLQKFVGQVVRNDPYLLTITLNVSRMGNRTDLNDIESCLVEITYPMLQRIRKFSKESTTPNPLTDFNPTFRKVISRNVEEVILKW